MFFGVAGIIIFEVRNRGVANFWKPDSRIRELMLGNLAKNLAEIRESGDPLGTLI